MMKNALLLFVLFAIAQAVMSQPTHRRYKISRTFDWLPNDKHGNYIDLYVTLLSVNQELIKTPIKPRRLFDLTEDGQQELIRSLAAKSADLVALNAALKEPLEKTDPPAVMELEKRSRIISNEFKKTFNFYVKGVEAKRINAATVMNDQADRIENFKLLLTIDPESQLKFLTWDKLRNQDTTINLGEITFSSNFEGSLSGSYGVKTTASTEANTSDTSMDSSKEIMDAMEVNRSNSSQTASKSGKGLEGSALVSGMAKYTRGLNAKRQFMEKQNLFSGYFEPKRFFIDLSAFEGIQIVGSTFVTMTCKFEGKYETVRFNKFENLSTASGINPPANITSYLAYVSYPDVTEPVVATLNYSFLYRDVTGAQRFYPEYKHWIKYLFGTTLEGATPTSPPIHEQPVSKERFDKEVKKTAGLGDSSSLRLPVLKEGEFTPKVFVVAEEGTSNYLASTDPAVGFLQFESYKEAFDFLTWLRITSGNSAHAPWLDANYRFTTGRVSEMLQRKVVVIELPR